MSEESHRGLVRRVDGEFEGRAGETGRNRGHAGGGDPGIGFGPTRTTPALGHRVHGGSRFYRSRRLSAFGHAVLRA